MTKFRLIEVALKQTKKTDDVECQQTVIWEGGALALHLGIHHSNIRQPKYISLVDGVVEVAYDPHSNVRVEIEDEGKSYAAAYCKPAITKEAYDEIVKANQEHAANQLPRVIEMVQHS